jgi:membrane associated rhomboid family serine protease
MVLMNFLEKFNIDFSKLDFFQKIIGVNILVFIFYKLTFLFRFQNDFISYFSLEPDFLTKPWSILTYAFIHEGLFELIFMIILLLFSSNSIANLLGKKITINLFFLGIFFGGVAYLLSGSKGSLIGSSAGISSLLFFLLLVSPNLGVRIFRFTIEFKYIMAFILFTDFLKLISPGQFGVYSHIGGYLVGIYYYYSLYGFPKKVSVQNHKKRKTNFRNKQNKIDMILDKISNSGYDSLSDEEKEYLFKQGGNK